MASVVSVSSMWIGSLSPSRASLCREPVGGVEQPGIAGFGGKQDQLADGHDTAVLIGRLTLNIAHLIGQTKIPAPEWDPRLPLPLTSSPTEFGPYKVEQS